MPPLQIFLPALVLALWTLCVLLLVPFARFGAARRREVTADDFRYGESTAVPPAVSLPNRNYMNLLEAPVLFYLACVIAYLTGAVNTATVALAWAYVALRIVHSVIHLSYNKVMHRLTAFALSNAVLAALLVSTLLALTARLG